MSTAPPPDFRYVGVAPGPTLGRVRRQAALSGFGAFALGLLLARHLDVFTLFMAALAGGFVSWIVVRGFGPSSGGERDSQAPMSIVPWGVMVHSEPMPRVLRWAALRDVRVDHFHEMDYATPSTRWSVVTIRTERETLGGRAPGSIGLERLEAYLDRYTEEACRPVSLDLDGQTALDALLEPAFERLLSEARRLRSSGELRERLVLIAKGYRDPGADPLPETDRVLAVVLASGLDAPADPRPLALILAAELRAHSVASQVIALTTSPNPLVAAVARGAALRLGADVKRTGALDEIDAFLPDQELAQIRAWATKTPHGELTA
jgi:hypothetical protein